MALGRRLLLASPDRVSGPGKGRPDLEQGTEVQVPTPGVAHLGVTASPQPGLCPPEGCRPSGCGLDAVPWKTNPSATVLRGGSRRR